MRKTIDTHCHLDIIQEQGQNPEDSLMKCSEKGTTHLVQIATDRQSGEWAKDISKKQDVPVEISFTIGCHPTETHAFPEAETCLELAKSEVSNPKFLGIGEIGIDLYHDASTYSLQRKVLDQFMDFASVHKLPVVIHSRDAAEQTFQALSEYKSKVFGVIHCFTYDWNWAKKFYDLGYYISFSGIVTFKSAREIQDAGKKMPLDGILIETDAPFLAPDPFRGKRNEPALISHTLEKMFSLREESNDEVEEKIYSNSLKFISRKAYHQ
jgi:TatD DNase family protein